MDVLTGKPCLRLRQNNFDYTVVNLTDGERHRDFRQLHMESECACDRSLRVRQRDIKRAACEPTSGENKVEWPVFPSEVLREPWYQPSGLSESRGRIGGTDTTTPLR